MIAGIYQFYLRLKKNGKIKPNVTWQQFWYSKCWYRKDYLTSRERYYNEKIILNGNDEKHNP